MILANLKRNSGNMKQTIFIAAMVMALTGCSTCYECTEDVITIDETSGAKDTTSNVSEFCTADQTEVDAREADGADCRIQ